MTSSSPASAVRARSWRRCVGQRGHGRGLPGQAGRGARHVAARRQRHKLRAWGNVVYSPLVGAGEVDVYLAFEKAEALRNLGQLPPRRAGGDQPASHRAGDRHFRRPALPG